LFGRGPIPLLLALLTLLTLAPVVRADPAAQARFHDERARHHYELREYEAAIREFLLEERLAPNPRTKFNVAVCFQQLDRSADAFAYFTEYLASEDQDPERRRYAEDALAVVSRRVARIEVTSEPAGAKIFVDRRELGSYGVTPQTVAVPPGTHRVWVELEGYRPAEGKVEARLGESASVQLLPVLIVGKVVVGSPRGASVVLRNGADVVVSQGRVPHSVELRPGSYQVEVRAAGYLPWRGPVMVEEGATATMTPTPERLPAPTGDMTVTSNVAGAVVELDGQPAGFTPVVLSGLDTQTHALAIRGQGTVPWEGSVEVRADERAWVTATLEPPAKVVRSPATWVFGGLGVASLGASAVLGYFAASAHADYEETRSPDDRELGLGLNRAGDVALVSGLVTTGVATALFFATAHREGRPSRATVARGER
jgi:outer membrane receptor for ferrienterochelin and colicins